MQNADIEELFPLVKVGTKVQLIYQTVLIQEDPLLHTKTITVYPDVYGQGVTAAQLSQELARLNWPQVFWPPLLTLLKNPTGEPHPLAWQWPLFFNGQATDLVAAEWKGAFYVPYDQPFDPRNPLALATVKWGRNTTAAPGLSGPRVCPTAKPKENSTSIFNWPTWAISPLENLFCLKMNFICVKAEGLLT